MPKHASEVADSVYRLLADLSGIKDKLGFMDGHCHCGPSLGFDDLSKFLVPDSTVDEWRQARDHRWEDVLGPEYKERLAAQRRKTAIAIPHFIIIRALFRFYASGRHQCNSLVPREVWRHLYGSWEYIPKQASDVTTSANRLISTLGCAFGSFGPFGDDETSLAPGHGKCELGEEFHTFKLDEVSSDGETLAVRQGHTLAPSAQPGRQESAEDARRSTDSGDITGTGATGLHRPTTDIRLSLLPFGVV
ncbi:hypothetical protein C8A01DRAFT_41028 [Parachaetomium inaequale]|uniref:Uncharacterized protein n=1 Tax=Parachaetomium inaequale TaxID=2588326 RepID=A0AAN6P6F0_9PEZI|nr:hypothetical protein C8A01DRAFT_41028 [Parachaetomium inaequale]